MATTTSEPGGQLTVGRRRLILVICCLSLLIVGIDSTIVNVALPDIQRSLHASVSGLQWTIDAYTLVLASLLMLSGSTADRFGRRRVFQLGLLLFTIGSLLCTIRPDDERNPLTETQPELVEGQHAHARHRRYSYAPSLGTYGGALASVSVVTRRQGTGVARW